MYSRYCELRDRLKLKDANVFIGKDVETLYKGFTAEEKRLFWRSIVKAVKMDANRELTVEYL